MDDSSDALDVIDAIFTTRAMRRLKSDPVPDEVIWAVLDAAIRGPSSGNVQRWGWIVVTDRAVKEQIGGWYLDAWNALGQGRREAVKQLARRVLRAPGAPPVSDPEDGDANRRAGSYLAHHIAEAPVWIFAVQGGIKGMANLVDGADIFGAIQNLMLAARKYGLGTTLTMLHRSHEREIARLLWLPADAQSIALIPLGYPMSKFSTPARNPVDTVTHWGRWGNTRRRPRAAIARGIA